MAERILVTGGAGFIGSAIVRVLQNLFPDLAVRVLDIVPSRISDAEYIEGSILDEQILKAAVKGCDYVAHLAGVLGVAATDSDPDYCRLVNIQGTWNVLKIAYGAGVRRLVFASSSEVYGEQPIQPIRETCELRPKSVYAHCKLQGERYVEHFRSAKGVDWRIVRFFNVYGPEQRLDFVIPRFIDSIAKGERPTVYGPGTQIRSFCYVDDAAWCCALALLTDDLSEWVFNVGNDSEPISIAELAERVISLGGHAVRPLLAPFSRSDRSDGREVWRRIPDIDRAMNLLNFRPGVSLTTGLRAVLARHNGRGHVGTGE